MLNDINKVSNWVIGFWLITSLIAGAKVYSKSGGLVPFLPISNTQENEPANDNYQYQPSDPINDYNAPTPTIL